MFNQTHEADIAAGKIEALKESSSAFIKKASGIEQRYVIEREGILDVDTMQPRLPKRSDDQMSVQCELAIPACERKQCKQPKSDQKILMR